MSPAAEGTILPVRDPEWLGMFDILRPRPSSAGPPALELGCGGPSKGATSTVEDGAVCEMGSPVVIDSPPVRDDCPPVWLPRLLRSAFARFFPAPAMLMFYV